MPEGYLNQHFQGPKEAPIGPAEQKEGPETLKSNPSQENEPREVERTSQEIAREIQKIDFNIETERTALNATRASLGLPSVQTSAAIEHLQDKRGKLTQEGAGERLDINPAIALYFTEVLGEQETIARLNYLSDKTLVSLREAVIKGNLPAVVHLMEMQTHAKLQRDKMKKDDIETKSDYQRLYKRLLDMDEVTRSHELNGLNLVNNLEEHDPREWGAEKEEFRRIFRQILK
jgi:hypothetical protein